MLLPRPTVKPTGTCKVFVVTSAAFCYRMVLPQMAELLPMLIVVNNGYTWLYNY